MFFFVKTNNNNNNNNKIRMRILPREINILAP